MKKVGLTKKEILSELNKLGIHAPSEIHSCLSEYKQYSIQQNSTPSSTDDGKRSEKEGRKAHGKRLKV